MDIIGLNQAGSVPYNQAMYAGKALSWLRDTTTLSIQSSWQANYRDVIIIGPLNGKVDSMNLTQFPLYEPSDPNNVTYAANRALMKKKLRDAATPEDTDNDKLPDFWERQYFGDLSRDGNTAGTGGLKLLQHYAHASLTPAADQPSGMPRIVVLPSGGVSVLFKRRRGTAFGLTVTPEFSNALASWPASAPGWQLERLRTLYDGSCGEEARWTIVTPSEWRYVRVRAVLP